MSKNKKELETIAEVGEFKGNKLIQIWEIDEDGQRNSDYPVVSFGKKKAKEIVKHFERIKEFADE